MNVQTTATGRDRAAWGPVPRWVVATAIAVTILLGLGAFGLSFTALADLAERAGIEGGQAWGWVLPVALVAVSVSADAAHTVVADIVLGSGWAAAIWAVPSPLALLAITHPSNELTNRTRSRPRGEQSSDVSVASRAVAVRAARHPGSAAKPRGNGPGGMVVHAVPPPQLCRASLPRHKEKDMSADRHQPDQVRTQTSPRHGHLVGSPDVEVLDPLRLHDPSRQWSAATAMDRWRGDQLRWVRAGDALAQICGRATGRRIVWTAQASQMPRLAPRRQTGTGRRAIARASATPRASQLPPLTAFGTRPDPQPSATRTGVSR